jgi:nucleoside-diphosphate-sugar epimerase
VTGGGGVLGKAVCKQLLARGHAVRALNRHDYPDLKTLGVEQCLGDLRNLDLVAAAAEGCDAIVHTAAKAGAWGSLQEYYEINVRGTDNVLAACEIHRINKLVYTSIRRPRRAPNSACWKPTHPSSRPSPCART